MHREAHLLDAAHVLAQVTEQLRELVRNRVSHRVRNVDRGGAGFDDGFDHLREEIELGARGVFGRELHVIAEFARDLHALDRHADDFLLRHVELELAMDGAGGQEHVDATLRRGRHRLRDQFDVAAVATREAADDGSLHLARHRVDALPVAARGGRESRFDDVHAQVRERARHPQLLGLRHAAARRLLAVAQRRIEDHHAFTGHGVCLVGGVVSAPCSSHGMRARSCLRHALELVIEIRLHEAVVVPCGRRRSP